MPKTEEEIREADKKEAEIKEAFGAEYKAAYQEFHEATKEEFKRYEEIWHPAKERWEAFAAPHFKKLQAKLVAGEKTFEEARAEVRRNWQECPVCGKSASRYQTHCSDDKCGTNLITGGKPNAGT